ncbi:UNVERIFIED_CONTAM: hypothetical protein Sradi_1557300 [Sesamum radiatum]|uniref:Uncharacterized protein n=1 Tax=Sesamum radiatum TaxID=300843 RepID=A0AAW2U8A2_SESRA
MAQPYTVGTTVGSWPRVHSQRSQGSQLAKIVGDRQPASMLAPTSDHATSEPATPSTSKRASNDQQPTQPLPARAR